MKELRCREVGFDCDAVVRAETVEEVLAQATPHAERVHRVHMTPALAGRLGTLVRDAEPSHS